MNQDAVPDIGSLKDLGDAGGEEILKGNVASQVYQHEDYYWRGSSLHFLN